MCCAHGAYPGQKLTAGNVAMGLGGRFELHTGEYAHFSVSHLMPIEGSQEGALEVGSRDDCLFHWKKLVIG